jgi:hypothetical protein
MAEERPATRAEVESTQGPEVRPERESSRGPAGPRGARGPSGGGGGSSGQSDYGTSVTLAFLVIGIIWAAKNGVVQSIGKWVSS